MISKTSFILTLLASIFILTGIAFAQDDETEDNALIGSIDITQDTKTKRTYNDIQDSAITYFQNMEKQLPMLASGTVVKLERLDGDVLNYLMAVYLHCTLKAGACPMVLDAILEIDLINSQVTNKNQCPNMKRFWKKYIEADVTRRIDFNLNIGLLNKSEQFKKNKRPKYIKCKDTIAEIRSNPVSNIDFFGKRYSKASPYKQVIHKMSRFLVQIEKKVNNIFVATGVKG